MYLIKGELKDLNFDELKEEMGDLLWEHTHRFYESFNCDWVDLEDIHQEMLVVMWNCTDKYDHTQGHFTTYLVDQIKSRQNEMQRYIYRAMRDASLNSDMELDHDVLERIPQADSGEGLFHICKHDFISQLNQDQKYVYEYLIGAMSFDQLMNKLQASRSWTYKRIKLTKTELQEIWRSVFDESLYV